MIKHTQDTLMKIKGTIVDLETTGNIDFSKPARSFSRYSALKPTILGYISDGMLVQYCAEGVNEIPALIKIMDETIPQLDKPYFALHTNFERFICQGSECYIPDPLVDVRGNRSGSKWSIRAQLGISTYDDPFNGKGVRCKEEWNLGNFDACLVHNRACLQIERDILHYTRGLQTF